MEIHELIIKSHVHVHAAELAVKTESPSAAISELVKLREMLNDQPELEAGGAYESSESP